MHSALVAIQPVRERPVAVPRHSTMSVNGTSIVHLVCDLDLGNSVRGLEHVAIGPHEWLLVDLTTVSSATQFACGALVTAMDRASPDRFCVVAAPRSPWIGQMLPRRAQRVTFQSMGDALQMLVLAEAGFGAAWLGGAPFSPVKLNVTQSWLAQCPLAPHALAAVARYQR